MSALDSLVNPTFAKDPPVKLNLDAKIVGIVLAILAGLGVLLGLLGLVGLFAVGAVGHILVLAFIGVLVALVADVMSAIGGWRMYQGQIEGKRLAIYGLALAFVAELIIVIGYGLGGSSLIRLVVLVLFYYAVVVSRFSSAATVQTP